MVAIAGPPGNIKILLRRRIELMPPGNSDDRFAYHRASELPASEAAGSIRRAKNAARKASGNALKDIVDSLKSQGFTVKAAGIPSSSRTVPKDLSAILGAHPLIHSAEGILFRQAVVAACKACGLATVSVRERDACQEASTIWGVREAGLRKQVADLRKSVGSPWAADHKTATMLALVAMKPVR